MMTTSFLQKNIPVLTDVIPGTAPVAETAPPVQIQPKTQQPLTPVKEEAAVQPANEAVHDIAPAQAGVAMWAQWKDEITENVMQTLLTEMDQHITQTVQEQLQGALAQLSASLSHQIKSNLEQALQETVTHAIEEELSKFKN